MPGDDTIGSAEYTLPLGIISEASVNRSGPEGRWCATGTTAYTACICAGSAEQDVQWRRWSMQEVQSAPSTADAAAASSSEMLLHYQQSAHYSLLNLRMRR